MSRIFHAKNRETGQRWKPDPHRKQYLVMYDSGYLAVVTEDFYTTVLPLDPYVWEVVWRNGHEVSQTTNRRMQ